MLFEANCSAETFIILHKTAYFMAVSCKIMNASAQKFGIFTSNSSLTTDYREGWLCMWHSIICFLYHHPSITPSIIVKPLNDIHLFQNPHFLNCLETIRPNQFRYLAFHNNLSCSQIYPKCHIPT